MLSPFTFHQADVKWIEFQAVPGPEARAMARKNHEARLVSWAGRALYLAWCRAGKPFFSREQSDCLAGTSREARDWVADGPAPFCGSTGGSSSGIFFPPMLFARHALASGPQPCLCPWKRISKVKGGKMLFSVDKVLRTYYVWTQIGPTIGSFNHWREPSLSASL